MHKSVFIFAIWVCHFIDVNGQNTVQIQATTPIKLNKDDLVITCSATGSLQSIISYSIVRNSTTGTEKTVVTNHYNVVNQLLTATWGDLSLQTRANLTGVSMPSPSATMVLTIPKNQVRCPQDAVGYQCRFLANPNTPKDPLTTETDFRYVDIRVEPTSMEPMTIGAQYNGQNVDTEDHTGRHIFRIGTTLTFSCNGMIGNPQRVPRWCYKKTRELNWLAPAFWVTNSPAIMVGCNYQMTTTLEYNVTEGDDDVIFMCESGSQNLCGFGDISSNKTIYLAHEKKNIPKRVVCKDDTCNSAAMFAAGFSSCLGLLLMVGISYLLARKFRIHKAAETTNNQTNNVNPYDTLHIQNNKDEAVYTSLSPTQPS